MHDLIITRSPEKDNMWIFHDIRKFSKLAHLKNETWYHYTQLRGMRSVISVWQAVNPGKKVFVEWDGDKLPLNTDSDWAVALLRFGP